VQILIIILIVALFVAFAIHAHRVAQQRKDDLMALAARHGWQFLPAKDKGMEARFAAFDCLQQGSNRYAYNVLEGDFRQRGICAFDYHYETYSTDSKGNTQTHHHTFSAAVLNAALPLKPLLIRPEGFFDKITEFFGADDIDFESAEFIRRFFVKAPNRRWAFDVLHARAMELLLASPVFTLQFGFRQVMAYRNTQFSAAEFAAAGDVISGLLDGLPPYVIRQQTGQDAPLT
jgi:hypothetical protein